MIQKKSKGTIILLIVAAIWGSGFIASQYALDAGVYPELLMMVRFTIAAIVIGVVSYGKIKAITVGSIIKMIPGGVFLFLAFFIQIVALQYTTPANNAFLTATNVVMVPFIWWGLTKKKPKNTVFIASVICLLGVFLLSIQPGSGIQFSLGDSLTLLCAVFFAGQIVATGLVTEKEDTLTIILIQFSVAAILSIIVFIGFTDRDIQPLMNVMGASSVAYLALCSTCLCYFLQTYAQKQVNASRVAIILGTEALFGSLFSVVLGFDDLKWNMILGGGIIMVALLMAEGVIGEKKK